MKTRYEYENDVFYEVWRNGGDPEMINYDRVDDRYYDGISTEDAALHELRRQMPRIEDDWYDGLYQAEAAP